ncbi:MAG TPA: type II toxin-antitoxin system RelE/ParE family toxin [Ignavibacteria bacterium]|nr:type II toxin-antitoxin system RelE/ParE family toxin [Ignavibacteria bacterium]
MDYYKIRWTSSSLKELKKLPAKVIPQIIQKAEELSENPFPPKVRKLAGSTDLFRIRFQDYRIVYRLEKNELIIVVIKVGHRKEVYKK